MTWSNLRCRLRARCSDSASSFWAAFRLALSSSSSLLSSSTLPELSAEALLESAEPPGLAGSSGSIEASWSSSLSNPMSAILRTRLPSALRGCGSGCGVGGSDLRCAALACGTAPPPSICASGSNVIGLFILPR